MKKLNLRSKALWVAVAGLVGLVLKDAGVIVSPEHFDGYVTALLAIGTLAGIIVDTTNGEK